MPPLKQFVEYAKSGNQVWAHRSSHGQHNLFEEHVHDFIELIYIVQGKGRHRINGTSYDIRTGDVFVIMPGESHHFPDGKDSNAEIINCLFPRETVTAYLPMEPGELLELPYLRPFYKAGERLPRKLSLSSRESTEVLARLEDILLEVKNDDCPGSNLLMVNLLINLLIGLSRQSLRGNVQQAATKPLSIGHEILVRHVNSHLESQYYQRIMVEDLARKFTVSPRHLNRIYREQTGKTLLESLQLIRIERAKHMLSETNQSVDSIASAVGFGDPSYFRRLFLRLVGSTPSRYRRQIIKGLNHRE